MQRRYDKLGLGKTIQGKVTQFYIVYQALNSPARQYQGKKDNLYGRKTNRIVLNTLAQSARQSNCVGSPS